MAYIHLNATIIDVVSAVRFRLNPQQVSKLADACNDMSQVFAASVVLPSIGFGGTFNTYTASIGIVLVLVFVALGLYLLHSPHSHDF